MFYNGSENGSCLYPQLLGLLGSLKGITSDAVASPCVLKLFEAGEVVKLDKGEQQGQVLSQFAAHFISDTDQPQTCNFANFFPLSEGTPLQVLIIIFA